MKTRITILFFLFSLQLKASHLYGGEITWKCITTGIDAGKFVFTLKAYRDCNGIPFVPPNALTIYSTNSTAANYPSIWSIPMGQATITDISPSFCPSNCNTGGPGTVQDVA